MSMSYSVSLPKKCCSIWPSGHGYQPVPEQEPSVSMGTRAQSTIKYDGTIKVFHLSMAGFANITTEMGIIHKNYDKFTEQSKFLTPYIVNQLLQQRSTEYATLTWLVGQIYGNKYDKSQEDIVRLKLEELKEEMLILEKLASIEYARFSLPDIIPNPTFNKVYSLRPNPGENIRNESSSRSGSVRLKGEARYNKVWAFYGLYILDTSDPEHAYFSISNLPVDKNGFVDDVHGWNFLGNIENENLELTRILKKGDDGSQTYKDAKAAYDKTMENLLAIFQAMDRIKPIDRSDYFNNYYQEIVSRLQDEQKMKSWIEDKLKLTVLGTSPEK